MFSVTRTATNSVYLQMSGKLTAEKMDDFLNNLLEASADIQDGTLLCEVIDYQWPTLDAIWHELSRMPELLAWLKQFRKMAVLSDKNWIKSVSEFKGLLIPNLEIKAFSRAEKNAAEMWLKQ